MIDLRDEFKDEHWEQGRLLLTRDTRRWTEEERQAQDAIERCCAFAFFSSLDEGRSRQFIYRFESAQACAKAIEAHNRAWYLQQQFYKNMR